MTNNPTQAEAGDHPNYALEARMDQMRRDQVRENVREMQARAQSQEPSDGE